MIKKTILAAMIIILLITLSSCALKTDDGETITGEVIEILPVEDTIIEISDDDEVIKIDDTKPTEEELSDLTVKIEGIEGDLMLLKPDAYDPDGDEIKFSFTKPFDEEGEWQTEEGDEGTYLITITASDGTLSTSEEVLVIIKPTNKAPVIECEDELSFKEGELVKLGCNIYDIEGSEMEIIYSGWMNSSEYLSGYDDAGEHSVTVVASDGERVNSKKIKIMIENTNRPPIVTMLEDIVVEETETITLEVDAYDPDEDELEYTYSENFNDEGVWETELGDSGTFDAYVEVSDGTDTVKKEFKVVVKLKNTVPTLEPISDIEVEEGETIELSINTYDREGDNLTITISGWMESETYTTTFEDAGTYTVVVMVSDGELTASQEVDITVVDVNRPPVFRIPA